MKIVLTVFAPILVAIAIRLLLFLIGLIIVFVIFVLQIDIGHEFENFLGGLFAFETFDWDKSWGYWILVIIGSFIVEMDIWEE